MALTIAPTTIEQTEFYDGDCPSLEPSSVPPTGLLDSVNLLPDLGTGALQTRAGFKRIDSTGQSVLEPGYRIIDIQRYFPNMAGGDTSRFLIIVTTNGRQAFDGNVLIYAYDLDAKTRQLISPADAQWNHPFSHHWGETINTTWYGGSQGNKMYSWNPDDGWDDDAGKQTGVQTLTNAPTDLALHYPRDYAFPQGTLVRYGGNTYGVNQAQTANVWEEGLQYSKGQLITVVDDWSGLTYPRSFKAIDDHVSSSGDRPGTGGSYTDHWTPNKIAVPVTADVPGLPKAWRRNPLAADTSIAAWHGNRLFLRYEGNSSGDARLQFSAPQKPKPDSEISTLVWDPKNFTPGNTENGEGGGWEDIGGGDGDPIMALMSYGTYLLIFKRRKTYVLSGLSADTWTKREIPGNQVGCISSKAVAEHDGLIYFLSDQGMYFTDGTVVKPVPGFEKIQDWFREVVTWDDRLKDEKSVSMWSYGGFVWVSVPTAQARRPDATVVYSPEYQSFFFTDLPVQAACIARDAGVDQLFFSEPTATMRNEEDIEMVSVSGGWTTTWQGEEAGNNSTVSFLTDDDENTYTNVFTDPGFETKNIAGSSSSPAFGDYDTIPAATENSHWHKTSLVGDDNRPAKMHFRKSPEAAFKGKLGGVITNLRKPGPNRTTDDNIGDTGTQRDNIPDVSDIFEGVYESIQDPTAGTVRVAFHVRRDDWAKNRKISFAQVRICATSTARIQPDFDIDDFTPIQPTNHEYKYIGKGWYRVHTTYMGTPVQVGGIHAGDPRYRYLGITCAPGLTVQLDKAICTDAPDTIPYFDGGGVPPVPDVGGQEEDKDFGSVPVIFQYAHPDVIEQPVDDQAQVSYSPTVIPWMARTAWFPFGSMQETRRLRRTWALVRGVTSVVLRVFRNYEPVAVKEVSRIPKPGIGTTYFEGAWAALDANAVSLSVEGLGAPAGVLGVAMHTQKRRWTYHQSGQQ